MGTPSRGTAINSALATRERNGGVKPFFKAEMRTDGVLELVVYEQIGEDYDWWSGETTGISAKLVKEKLESMEYSSILMRINSPGGDAFEGIAILNLLRSQDKPVNVKIDGIAASAASIIAMAGTTIEMGSGAMMMIHNAWGFCMGNTHDMLQNANALAAIDKSIASTYVDRTALKLEDVQAMMDAETWMDAQACVDKGFATGLQSAPTIESKKALAMAKNFGGLKKFANVPDKLKPRKAKTGNVSNDEEPDSDAETECLCECVGCMDGHCENCTLVDCVDPNCVDCPMQGGTDASAHAGIHVLAAMLRTQPAVNLQLRGTQTILAVRHSGQAAFNLIQVPGASAPVARINGALAPYGKPSCDLGGYVEVYEAGCFTASLESDNPRVLFNHNIDAILGLKSSGTARFTDTAEALVYEADLPNTQAARDLRESMERGDICGSSAAFFIDAYRWENRDGVRTRVIEKARLVEGGPHTFAAYVSTSAALTPAAEATEVSADTTSADLNSPAAVEEEVPAVNNEIEQYEARLHLLKVA